MTIRSKLICGFIFIAFLAGGLSYAVLHTTSVRDATFTRRLRRFSPWKIFALLAYASVSSANEAERLTAKKRHLKSAPRKKKKGEVSEEALSLLEARYEQALSTYAAFLDGKPEEMAFLRRLTEAGRSLQQQNQELPCRQETRGGGASHNEKGRTGKSKDAF
jgi:CHASE3 domain sensor protein